MNQAIKRIYLILFIFGSCFQRGAAADDCTESVAYYLDLISNYPSQPDSSGLISSIRCLWRPALKYVEDFEEFASDSVLTKIEKETRKDRLEVYKTLFPLINSRYDIIKGEAAAALAYYHYHPAAERLSYFPNDRMKVVLYSILEFKNGMEWAINYYDRISVAGNLDSDSTYIDKISVLNLVYHLCDPKSLIFLDRVINDEKDGRVRSKAEKIKERLIDKFPELGSH
jgi:hypothetical protein